MKYLTKIAKAFGMRIFGSRRHPQPLPAESLLWSLPNVFITPHCSGNSPRVKERSLALFLNNFTRYRQGKPLRNIVDQTVGY